MSDTTNPGLTKATRRSGAGRPKVAPFALRGHIGLAEGPQARPRIRSLSRRGEASQPRHQNPERLG